MANVYEGKTDERQSVHPIPVTRFRPRYRALTDEEKALHDEIKDAAAGLEKLFDRVSANPATPHSRYHALALTALEESIMWVVKDLTS